MIYTQTQSKRIVKVLLAKNTVLKVRHIVLDEVKKVIYKLLIYVNFYLVSTEVQILNVDLFAGDNFVLSSGCLTPHENTGGDFDPLGQAGPDPGLGNDCSHILAVGLGDILQRRRTRKYFPGGAKYQKKTEQNSLSH